MKLAIFDVGGTLVDSQAMIAASLTAAFRAEQRASKSYDERDVREMEALDAAGNLILAILMHLDEVMPILRRYARKWGRDS